MTLHPSIGAPLGALDHAGVRWCLLRGEGELARVPAEVDLLVARADMGAARAALAEVGRFTAVRAWGRGPHRFFCSTASGGHGAIKLDIVVELAFGPHQELHTATADAVLAHRRRDGALALPAPSDAFWALALHALLDRRGGLRPDQARRLAQLAPPARDAPSPLADVVAHACPSPWTPGQIVDAAAAERWAELEQLAPRLVAGWPGGGRARRAGRVTVSRVLRRVGRRANALSGRAVAGSRS